MSGLNPMIEQFCDALLIEDGLAKNSLLAYRRDLVGFEGWLSSHSETVRPPAAIGASPCFGAFIAI
jgi:integrase/recombinase XerD